MLYVAYCPIKFLSVLIMSINRISTLEVCGENSALYTPEWPSVDRKLVSLDVENSEEDARIVHNFNVLEELSKKQQGNFLKDIEIFKNSIRFRPFSKLFNEETGETVYLTGNEEDPVRFLFYTKPEGIQPEIPFKDEDILNMERPLPVTEVDRVDMIMHEDYIPSGEIVEQEFSQINFSIDVVRSIGFNKFHDCPVSYFLPGEDGWSREFPLGDIRFSGTLSATGIGYSPEGKFYGKKEEYIKTLREMGRLTSEEGRLTPFSIFLKVEEDRKEGFGTTTLRISL
jgi:hypothetical protein